MYFGLDLLREIPITGGGKTPDYYIDRLSEYCVYFVSQNTIIIILLVFYNYSEKSILCYFLDHCWIGFMNSAVLLVRFSRD